MKSEPAFPVFHQNEITGYIPPESAGMTLRDYFAAKAMQAIVSKEVSHVSWVDEYAKNAYKMADAMLKARGG
jgi:hypothetical protein